MVVRDELFDEAATPSSDILASSSGRCAGESMWKSSLADSWTNVTSCPCPNFTHPSLVGPSLLIDVSELEDSLSASWPPARLVRSANEYERSFCGGEGTSGNERRYEQRRVPDRPYPQNQHDDRLPRTARKDTFPALQ